MKSNVSENKIGTENLTSAERRHALVGPSDLWESKRAFQIDFLHRFGLKSEHYLLDVGCGTLRGGLPLIAYLEKEHYFGFDVSEEVLAEGRKELEESGLNWKRPTIMHVPDVSQLRLPAKFDFIWAFSVLIHMSDRILNDTLRFVQLHLADTGVFYANVRYGKKEDGKWKWAQAVWRSLEFYKAACARYGLSVVDMGALQDFGHVSHREDADCQRMLKISPASAIAIAD
jgi:cyclopropane fatty-acyl-phospholipid synthase-like methyltransferase